MDTSRSNLYQEDVTELLSMLELSDIQAVNGVKALIHENLNGTKDILLLQSLVNYYIACQSKHALEILVKVRDPHDKHLFDKIAEYMKDENMRYQCLVLLSHIVHSQPPWLHKISNHRIFQTLLALLKSEKDSPSLLCALFIIVCLLPMIPSQIGPYLNDIFDVFSRLTSWSVKNSIGVPEIYVLHLQVGVYALFHRLYGMYPCNFLGYLRSYYGRKEYREDNLGVFVNAIKPMLQRVKLHPLLVTSCKETEVNFKRWRKMAPHDIIVECSNVSLDAIEGGCEDVYVKNTSCNSGFSENMHPFSNENSSHHVSFSSQNSAVLTVDPNSLVSESMNVKQDVICSPSLVCDVDTPAQMLYAASELDDSAKKLLDRLPQNKVDSELQANSSVDEKSIELADKEVSELTSSTANSNVQECFEVRHDTPFCSTTQNLTDNPEIPDIKPIDLLKDKDEEEQTNISQEPSGIETLVQKINRFRYLSHCGMLPELSNERSDRPIVARSISCPDIFNEQTLSNSVMSKSATMKVDMSPTFSPDVLASCPSTMHSSTPCSSPHVVDTQYAHLIPMIVQPISQVEDRDGGEKSTSNTHITSPSCNFTPAELLDRHILLSNEIYISQLNSIPLTSTKNVNWTHFGGKPPADEVAILQTQIMLLHNQLMFERHRCEIHRERNRRLLGKARRTRMQEEYTTALKDQVSLLEKENHKLQQQVAEVHELYRTMYQEKNLSDNNADSTIKKLAQDKNTLQYSIKTLQGLLVAQKQDMDAISNTCKLDKPKIVDLELEIEMLRRDKATLVKGEKEFLQLSNQNALLQKLNELYLQRLEAAKEPIIENDTIDLIRDAAAAEIKALKEILEAKSLQVDICLKKINELEKEASSLKLKVIEQIQITENVEALHKDEIAARDDRLSDLKKIIHQTESHVLQLYHVQDQLNDKIKVLSSKPKVPSVAGCSSDTSNTPMSDEHTFTCDEENIQNLLTPEQENIQETSELE